MHLSSRELANRLHVSHELGSWATEERCSPNPNARDGVHVHVHVRATRCDATAAALDIMCLCVWMVTILYKYETSTRLAHTALSYRSALRTHSVIEIK